LDLRRVGRHTTRKGRVQGLADLLDLGVAQIAGGGRVQQVGVAAALNAAPQAVQRVIELARQDRQAELSGAGAAVTPFVTGGAVVAQVTTRVEQLAIAGDFTATCYPISHATIDVIFHS